MNDDRCAKCNRIIDPRGVWSAYCGCICGWPYGGCRVRIYFLINLNQKVQPFTLITGNAHHRECPPFDRWKREQRRLERAADRIAKMQDDIAIPGQKNLEAFR